MSLAAVDQTLTGPAAGNLAPVATSANGPTGHALELEVAGATSSSLVVPADAVFVRFEASVELLVLEPAEPSILLRCQLVCLRDGAVVDTSTTEALHPTTNYPLRFTTEVDAYGDGAEHSYGWGFRFWTGTNMPAAPDLTVLELGPLTVRAIAVGPAPDVPPPVEPSGWPTGADLEAHLGGALPEGLAVRLAAVAAAAVAPSVTVDPSTGPGPGAWLAALLIAADLYRASSSLEGGSYALDGSISFPVNVTSNLVRRYAALLAPTPAPSGMVG